MVNNNNMPRRPFDEFMLDVLPDELRDFWSLQINRYIGMSGLKLPYSKEELAGILKWFVHNGWELTLENTNWRYIRGRGGDYMG